MVAAVQGFVAASLLIWWAASDFWEGAGEPDVYYVLPLLAVILLDALVILRAMTRMRPIGRGTGG